MQSNLILCLLQALEKRGSFKPGRELGSFLEETVPASFYAGRVTLGEKAKDLLWGILEREHGIARGTTAKAFSDAGLARSEALSLSTNEKTSRRPVRQDRVAVKAAPGGVVLLDGQPLRLPAGMNLDIHLSEVQRFAVHSVVILVENWEAFESLDTLSFSFPEMLRSALVVYRGDVSAYPVAAAKKFLEIFGRPVYVFSDQDPEGLIIAMTTPGYAGLAFPPMANVRKKFLEGRGLQERFLIQLPKAEARLEACEDPAVSAYWRLMKEFGRALPQEEFVHNAGFDR